MPPAAPPDLLSLHRQNNRETAEAWDHFQEHRRRVTALAFAGAPAGGVGRVAVLGAGNCNDLDLQALADHFGQVHLVDLDVEAVERARQRQSPAVAAKLVLHAPVDLSGAITQLKTFRHRPASPAELATLPGNSTRAVLAALPAGFDVVISTCFLSQLLQSAFVALGEDHAQLHILACALALAHLRAVAQMTAPGGTAHLVTDAVSTESYPLEELWGHKPPAALLDELEQAGNVFSGTGPRFLRRILATDAQVAPLLAGPVRPAEPWLWRFSPERSYLVYALSFDRRAAGAGEQG